MNSYSHEDLKESIEVTDHKELLKLELNASFLKITGKMKTEDVIAKTGLHKSDISRLRAMNLSRFSIDRLIGLLDSLGFATQVKVGPKKVS